MKACRRRQRRQRALGGDGNHRRRHAHRLHQRRQPLLVRADVRQQELSSSRRPWSGPLRALRASCCSKASPSGLLGGVLGARRRVCRPTPVDRIRARQSAASQRDLARCPFARLHARALCALRIAFGFIPACAMSSRRKALPLLRRDAHRERQPGAPARPQYPRRRPGRHGAGAAHQRGAHDPHLRGDAQRRARLLRSRITSRSCASPFRTALSTIQSPSHACRTGRSTNSAAIPGVSSVGFTASVPTERSRTELE